MATYRGRKSDICRIVGYNIWGKAKCPSTKRPYPPGQHGPNAKNRRPSEYGEQLLAKQTIRRYYNMLEKQFANTFAKAQRMSGNTSLNFLRLLELRLSTVVWRLHLAKSIFQARQMVSHGHITVNGKPVNIASYQLKVGDTVEVRDREASKKLARENVANAYGDFPKYLEADPTSLSGRIVANPERDDFPRQFQEQQVVEFYAR